MSVKIGPKHITVRRRIGGVMNCKYFSLLRKDAVGWRNLTAPEQKLVEKAAHEYDRELEAKNVLLKSTPVVFDPKSVSAKNNTGVRGITWRKQQRPDGMVYAFFVCCYTADKKVHSRYYQTNTRGWKAAWVAAVNNLAEIKDIPDSVARKLRTQVPPESIQQEYETRVPRKARAAQPQPQPQPQPRTVRPYTKGSESTASQLSIYRR